MKASTGLTNGLRAARSTARGLLARARLGTALLASLVVPLAVSLVAPSVAQAGELVQGGLASQVMGRELRYNVYLPTGYEKGNASYPVVYLLHGASGNENDWSQKGSAVETLDGLIAQGHIRPSIAVMPSIGPQSWFADGAAVKMETALITELLPAIEAKYRVAPGRANRSVAGLSMGGYGALNLSLRNPDKFCAAGVISPAIYDPLPPETSAARKAAQFQTNGQFDPELWKRLNYPSHLEAYSKAPQKVPMWIVSGDHDFLGIAVMSANLYWRLNQIQPRQVELRIVDGDHEWMVFRDALPDALRYTDRMCQKSN